MAPYASRTDASILSNVTASSTRRSGYGVDLHVVSAGPEDGPLVVLLHGFPEFWYGWRDVIGPLAEAGFRVLAPDQRGYNLSEKPDDVGAYRFTPLSRDVQSLIRAAGRESAHVVGHDWGGGVAWDLALRYPAVVDSLAICNAPHPTVFRKHLRSNPRQLRKSWYMLAFQLPRVPEWLLRRDDFDRLASALADRADHGSFAADELAHYRSAWDRPGALSAMIDWYRASFRYRETPPRTVVEQPTLVVWGEDDFGLEPALGPASLERCVTGRLERFPDVGHWIVQDRSEAVADLLIDHVSGE